MPWSVAAPIVGAAVGGLMSDGDKNGGAGAQQQTRDPWSAAQPWLRSNIAQGQNLQNQYSAQPFNQAQLDAYGNMGAHSDYMRQLVPGLLGTASRQQLGFDRSNPNARPEAYKFDAPAAGGGLLGSLTGKAIANYGAANPLPQAPAPQRTSTFVQQQGLFGETEPGAQVYGGPIPSSMYERLAPGGQFQGQSIFNGGYGDFKYGMPPPQPGTPAYRDMQEYFMYGGADPYNMYGKGTSANRYLAGGGLLGAMGPDGGPGSGGIGAAGGAGAGSAAGGPGW